jgi:hypothetical protein
MTLVHHAFMSLQLKRRRSQKGSSSSTSV